MTQERANIMHGQTNIKSRGQQRFRIRPYGVRWLVYDSKTKRIAEFFDSKGEAVQLCATLNSQLHDSPGWRALGADL